MSIILLKDMRN